VIVIDAGHGGRDPGAISVNGLQEKEVTLDSALRLRAILERTGRYHVALTRDADAFVELADRVAFARAQGADLFVSLHADAHDNHEAHGASIYTLSEQGSARAQRLMGRQNWQIDLGDAPREGVVGAILVDLAQRDTTNRSAVFAQQVIERFTGVTPLLRNTHRNAGFFVLLAPDVPAVLIEMGFLTNASDEQRLSTPAHRERLMRALATAIDAHFSEPQIVLAAR
jgi:N-acetylmuramoyl-L-alanine amidase